MNRKSLLPATTGAKALESRPGTGVTRWLERRANVTRVEASSSSYAALQTSVSPHTLRRSPEELSVKPGVEGVSNKPGAGCGSCSAGAGSSGALVASTRE